MPAQTKIQMRQGTATEWTTANPILANGENGYETDTKKFKIGDGTSTWSALDYFTSSSNTLTQFGSTTSTRTNLIVNPSFEGGSVTGWGGPAGWGTTTSQARFGTYSAQLPFTTAGPFGALGTSYYSPASALAYYTGSGYVLGETGKAFTFEIREYDSAFTILGTTVFTYTASTSWQRASGTIFTKPTTAYVSLIVRNTYAGAHTIYVDGFLLEASNFLGSYFDGSTTATRNQTYAWTGTANNSTSTETRTIGTSGSADFIYTNSVQSNTQQLLVGGVDYDLMRLQGQNQDRSFVETMSRVTNLNASAGTSGNAWFTFFTPATTLTVSTITVFSTGTAASGLTLARMGLYTFDGSTATLVARTASDTTLFAATYTTYIRSFDTTGGYPATYTLQAGQRYAFALVLTGTTMPQLLGVTSANASTYALTPRFTGVVTSQTDLPITQTAFSTSSLALYGRLA
jgi:hypothetical protein